MLAHELDFDRGLLLGVVAYFPVFDNKLDLVGLANVDAMIEPFGIKQVAA